MASFHVRDAFALAEERIFVLAGFVVEGEVKAGMSVRFPIRADLVMTEKIDHIQVTSRPDGDVTGLCLRYAEPGDLRLWEALAIRNRIIEVVA